jgi:hypothetical protein
MPDDLYQRDIVRWCNQQADLLRRLAAGERLNEHVDWPNVIEEIEALGRSETRACESFLRLALLHMLKQLAWPQHKAVPHWREETWHYLFDAQRAFSPSMRQQLDLNDIYRQALRELRASTGELGEAQPVPEACSLELSEMLAGEFDPADLLSRLGRG